MATWEPDIDPFDRDEIGEEDYRWDDTFTNKLETRLNELRQFNKTLDESRDEDLIDITIKTKNALKKDTIELIANEIYDKLTNLFNPILPGLLNTLQTWGGGVFYPPS